VSMLTGPSRTVGESTTRSESGAGALVASRLTMGRMARRAASALVVAEEALAIVLLVGAGLILRDIRAHLAHRSRFSRGRRHDRDDGRSVFNRYPCPHVAVLVTANAISNRPRWSRCASVKLPRM
jgi:hypothetical protein